MLASVRLLAIRSRQRATRNLAAKRATGILLEQLGQLLAHAVRHAAFDWLRRSTKPTIKHFLDGGDAHSLALKAGTVRSDCAGGRRPTLNERSAKPAVPVSQLTQQRSAVADMIDAYEAQCGHKEKSRAARVERIE
jgi:hypothetical protein